MVTNSTVQRSFFPASVPTEIFTSMVSHCHKSISYNEDALTVNFWNINKQQRQDLKEQKMLTKEHSVCTVCADKVRESSNVQERKQESTRCFITDPSAYKSIPVHGTFRLKCFNPFLFW